MFTIQKSSCQNNQKRYSSANKSRTVNKQSTSQNQYNNQKVTQIADRLNMAEQKIKDLQHHEKSYVGINSMLNEMDVSPSRKNQEKMGQIDQSHRSPNRTPSHSFYIQQSMYKTNQKQKMNNSGNTSNIINNSILDRIQQSNQNFSQNSLYTNNNGNLKQNNNNFDLQNYNTEKLERSNSQLSIHQQSVQNNTNNSQYFSVSKPTIRRSNTVYTNQIEERKDQIFKEILNKMQIIKCQGNKGIQNQVEFISQKFLECQDWQYDIMGENEIIYVKILCNILYNELEKQTIIDKGSSINLRLKLQDLEKEIQGLKYENSQIDQQLMEKTMKLNNFQNKYVSMSQRVQDLKWILDESKNLYDYFLQDFGKDRFNMDENQKIKLVQFQNIYKEYQNLQEKFSQIDFDDQDLFTDKQSTFIEGLKNLNSQIQRSSNTTPIKTKLQRFTENIQESFPNNNKFYTIKQQLSMIENEFNSQQTELEEQAKRYKELYAEQLLENQNLQQYSKQGSNNQGSVPDSPHITYSINKQYHYNQPCGHEKQLPEKQPEEVQNIKKQIIDLKNQNYDLRSENHLLQDKKEKVKDLHKQNGLLQEEIDNLKGKVDQTESNKNRMIQNYDKQLEEIQNSIQRQQSSKSYRDQQNNHVQKENNQLKKELQDCIDLLQGAKQNSEYLESQLKEKDFDIIKQQKDHQDLNQENQKKEQELQKLEIQFKEMQLRMQEQSQQNQQQQLQAQGLKQEQQQLVSNLYQYFMQYLQKDGNPIIKELEPSIKQMANEVFGEQFIKLVEEIGYKGIESKNGIQEFKSKYIEQLESKRIWLDNVKLLGETILKGCEIMQRQSMNKLPADMLMLKEDFEMKKMYIQGQLSEAEQEEHCVRQMLNNLNFHLMDNGERISDISKGNIEESRFSEKYLFNEVKSENEQLKCKLETVNLENTSLRSQINMQKQNSYNNMNNSNGLNNYSSNCSCGNNNANYFSEDIHTPLSQKPKDKSNRIPAGGKAKSLQEKKFFNNSHNYKESSTCDNTYIEQKQVQSLNSTSRQVYNQNFGENEECLQLIFMQANSIEQLLQNQ